LALILKEVKVLTDKNPEEITVDKESEEVAADEAPEEVAADKTPEEVAADKTPEEVVADESPEDVTVFVKPVEAIVDKIPEEHYVKQGDPDKPTYYIIRRLPETTGFLARYRMVAGHVRYAMSKGWIPVVDMQNYASPYLDPKKFGKENAWEYYFEQPMRIGLDEAYSGENIILSNGDCVKPYPGHSLKMLERVTDELTEWRMLIKLGLIKIKPALMEEILATRDNLFSREDRVLGVNMRGTDYLVRKIKGRPIPPPVDFAKSIVNAKLKDWNCNKFFLATEDKKILESFQDTFGYRCVILDRGYVDYNSIKDKWVSVCRINRENDHYLQGKEYLTQIVILSMCNSLVAARCSGTTTTMMLADKFEHTYFFNVGRYGNITLD
jgi:hypothetical protein